MNVLVFYDEKFPYPGERPSAESIRLLSEEAELVDAEGLAERLASRKREVLVHLHGPYFPKEAWPAILGHLEGGGGLLHAGGVPFRQPVSRNGGGWRVEREQLAYHQLLDIHDALSVDVQAVKETRASAEFPVLSGHEGLFGLMPTIGLTLHPTKSSDMPAEMGSSGPMDAVIYPLLTGVDADGRGRCAPVVMLEQYKGVYAGGRWILINQQLGPEFWAGDGPALLGKLARFAGLGVTELWLKPNYASFEPGEQAMITIQLQALARTETASRKWTFSVAVYKDGEEQPVWTARAEASAGREQPDLQFVRLPVRAAIEPGLYHVVCEAESDAGEQRVLTQGFWGMDRALLQSGEPLKAGRDYFTRGGKPVPIVGMTYMASDVARKFLHLPNVQRWDSDMAEMSRAGINLIRTGVWTAYRMIMFADGHAAEEVMRAIDAFILTAKKHGLEVTFTFFSFAPETWEGLNPYLDPRSVEAEKRFIASIVSRHQGTVNVHWDLINEPSLFNPKRIFEGPVTAADPFERKAWGEWLHQRYEGDLNRLQECWNMTPDQLPSFASAPVPNPDDTAYHSVLQPKKRGPMLDYALFSMDMHNRWAGELIGTIRRSDPEQLATVGQDEGICSQRPSPFFYAPAVDYTTVHSWWQMDHLAWDGIFTKTPDKPNLVQETGIMHIQRPDGMAKRSEEELRNILERKYAYAFSTGAAGAVQWIWNINYFMDNANESNIGALRADGTQKPEADVSYDFGRFMKENAALFDERKLEDVAVVYPFSNDFSSRKLAFEATTRAVRTLTFGLNVHPRGASEYDLESLHRHPAKLIIVPSAHNFADEAFEELVTLAESGSTVLWTGPLRIDAYWGHNASRLKDKIAAAPLGNVLREELLELGGGRYPVSFGEKKIGLLELERLQGTDSNQAQGTVTVPLGKGKWIWCPLPVELNERWEAIEALYEEALSAAGLSPELEWLKGGELAGIYGRKLEYGDGNLFVFVSEYGGDAEIRVYDPQSQNEYAFQLPQERSVLFATDAAGNVTSVYRPEQVKIERAEKKKETTPV
ncbi:glycoside hydrolase [Paenibacillus yonginensis]|uniref:Glycoside hydrolase n=1 Tax=Paenibacillus yonginensis TaxID=1462996 RepID=A0A1B1MVN8_9BACL|nr:beta-galactosidase [Paenibacillus yonginensis]ANS73252.1 glycoside hydrolase [Paenibacillus yonginensis]